MQFWHAALSSHVLFHQFKWHDRQTGTSAELAALALAAAARARGVR